MTMTKGEVFRQDLLAASSEFHRLVLVESKLARIMDRTEHQLLAHGATSLEIVQAMHVVTTRLLGTTLCCEEHAQETIEDANAYLVAVYAPDRRAENQQ